MDPSPEQRSHTQHLARAIDRARLQPGLPFPCPYLPGRTARHVVIAPRPFAPGLYQALMELNFRRLGAVVYRPHCAGCRECRALRVPVAEFRPDRAQRRCRARNADVTVEVGLPRATQEKHALYRRYLAARHDGQMDGSWEEFARFLYDDAPETTFETACRVEGRLVAVGIVDAEPEALSAVYCYFDPDQTARSPGVFSVLWLIDECRRRRLPHLYLGYYVAGSRAMVHKARYRPHEVLELDGRWRRVE